MQGKVSNEIAETTNNIQLSSQQTTQKEEVAAKVVPVVAEKKSFSAEFSIHCIHEWNLIYSLRPKLWTKYCFMKQNCQIQSGIAQYENAGKPVSSKAIHATH